MKFGVKAPYRSLPTPGVAAELKDTSEATHLRLRIDGYTLKIQGLVLLIRK